MITGGGGGGGGGFKPIHGGILDDTKQRGYFAPVSSPEPIRWTWRLFRPQPPSISTLSGGLSLTLN